MANVINYAAVFNRILDEKFYVLPRTMWMENTNPGIVYEGGREVKVPMLGMDGLGNAGDDFFFGRAVRIQGDEHGEIVKGFVHPFQLKTVGTVDGDNAGILRAGVQKVVLELCDIAAENIPGSEVNVCGLPEGFFIQSGKGNFHKIPPFYIPK